MGQNSKIEWTHHTFNPWRGCTKVSAGCANCYADKLSHRNPKTLGIWGKSGTRVVAADSAWREPLKWDRLAAEAGERHRVFCASLADVAEGHDTMPTESWEPLQTARRRLGQTIDATPNLDWLLLTKRPENIAATLDVMFPNGFQPRQNIWWGTSVEHQEAADQRIPQLLKCRAVVRFLSCEPLLGAIDFRKVPGFNKCGSAGADILRNLWVIVGGESGPGARPMHPDWARSLRDQCTAAGVAFHFKQWGEWAPATREYGIEGHIMPESGATKCGMRAEWIGWDGTLKHPSSHGLKEPIMAIARVGKKAAGRLLDGRTWDEMPTAGAL